MPPKRTTGVRRSRASAIISGSMPSTGPRERGRPGREERGFVADGDHEIGRFERRQLAGGKCEREFVARPGSVVGRYRPWQRASTVSGWFAAAQRDFHLRRAAQVPGVDAAGVTQRRGEPAGTPAWRTPVCLPGSAITSAANGRNWRHRSSAAHSARPGRHRAAPRAAAGRCRGAGEGRGRSRPCAAVAHAPEIVLEARVFQNLRPQAAVDRVADGLEKRAVDGARNFIGGRTGGVDFNQGVRCAQRGRHAAASRIVIESLYIRVRRLR